MTHEIIFRNKRIQLILEITSMMHDHIKAIVTCCKNHCIVNGTENHQHLYDIIRFHKIS